MEIKRNALKKIATDIGVTLPFEKDPTLTYKVIKSCLKKEMTTTTMIIFE